MFVKDEPKCQEEILTKGKECHWHNSEVFTAMLPWYIICYTYIVAVFAIIYHISGG